MGTDALSLRGKGSHATTTNGIRDLRRGVLKVSFRGARNRARRSERIILSAKDAVQEAWGKVASTAVMGDLEQIQWEVRNGPTMLS